mmetsp:Transcript_25435/g.77190  ORF Transcript_25435/g.77190 Transcript_25435/m.77190 type:complete len:206 (-) Transcript_25435:396-1013(-)|eukprot:scaffold112219_cov27-Tisochrysis_lutea.AAC.2
MRSLAPRGYYTSSCENPSLGCSVHVGPQDPLIFDLLLVYGPKLDLVEPQIKARAYLVQMNIRLLFRIDVMSERDEVRLIDEGNDTLGIRLGNWKKVLQYCADTSANLRGQIVQDEVRICLRHVGGALDIVTHRHVHQPKVCRRAVRQMSHNKAVRHAPVFLQDDQVSETVRARRLDDLFDCVAPSVHPLAIGEDKLHLLHELDEL